jgi:hypothetical protein
MHSIVLVSVVLFCRVALAEDEIVCNPPKIIPDADKAPSIYYSIDSKQCDKVSNLALVQGSYFQVDFSNVFLQSS